MAHLQHKVDIVAIFTVVVELEVRRRRRRSRRRRSSSSSRRKRTRRNRDLQQYCTVDIQRYLTPTT